MNTERIDDLVDIIGERYAELENTFIICNNLELAKFIDNPETWKRRQMANKPRYKQVLIDLAKTELRKLNDALERVYLLSYQQVNKDTIDVTRTEIVVKDIPKSVLQQISKMQKQNLQEILTLANISYRQYTNQVKIISALSTPDNFYDVFRKQTIKGVDKGLMVTYKDGRQFTWKAYMEMNARTTIHHELGEEQIRAGTSAGIIFYMCDSFADCAPDHQEYQGKLYYNADANIPDDVMDFIQSHGIRSMQEVRDGDPFLTTRPNCRHNFHAIPTEEAMGKGEKQILEDEKLSKGKYKDSNYEKVQEQRKIERTIRKYKMRKENGEALYQATGRKDFKPTGHEDALIRKWQAISRQHVKENPALIKRDYDRENIRVITQDLGVRYDLRKK